MESIVKKAAEFAKKYHFKQKRRSTGAQYASHPGTVASLVKHYSKDTGKLHYLIAAAILHDVVEDTSATIELVEQEFGKQVADLVLELTNDDAEMKVLGKPQYLANKMIAMSSDALTIKLCDRLHNILEMEGMPEKFQKRYSQETDYILFHLQEKRHLTSDQRIICYEILDNLPRNAVQKQ